MDRRSDNYSNEGRKETPWSGDDGEVRETVFSGAERQKGKRKVDLEAVVFASFYPPSQRERGA